MYLGCYPNRKIKLRERSCWNPVRPVCTTTGTVTYFYFTVWGFVGLPPDSFNWDFRRKSSRLYQSQPCFRRSLYPKEIPLPVSLYLSIHVPRGVFIPVCIRDVSLSVEISTNSRLRHTLTKTRPQTVGSCEKS